MQGVLQITLDNQDSVLFMIFRQPKIYIFIRRHWQSAFVIYPTIQYPSHTEPDLHHDVAVHPKSHSLLVRPLGLTAGEMYSVGEIYIKTPPTTLSPSSFSSAPPPAIEISTPWEIIVRVSSASDLPRPWQLLGGLSRLHLFTSSGAFGLPSRGLWIPFWFRSSSFALMFLPFTPHFATRLA